MRDYIDLRVVAAGIRVEQSLQGNVTQWVLNNTDLVESFHEATSAFIENATVPVNLMLSATIIEQDRYRIEVVLMPVPLIPLTPIFVAEQGVFALVVESGIDVAELSMFTINYEPPLVSKMSVFLITKE